MVSCTCLNRLALKRFTPFIVLLGFSSIDAMGQINITLRIANQGEVNPRSGHVLLKPTSEIVVTIENGSSEIVAVPMTYEPSRMRVCALGSNGARTPLVLYRNEKHGMGMGRSTLEERKPKMISIPVGAKQDVLRLRAQEAVFAPADPSARDLEDGSAESKWVWGWAAHPMSDYSPFELRKGKLRSSVAVLWCEFESGRQTLRSPPISMESGLSQSEQESK